MNKLLPIIFFFLIISGSVLAVQDVSLTKIGQTTADINTTVTYTINVTNNGTENLTSATLDDSFAFSMLSYTNSSVSQGVAFLNASDVGSGTISWRYNLTVNSSLVIEVNFTTLANGVTTNNVTVKNSSMSTLATGTSSPLTISTPGPYTNLWNNAQNATFFPGNIDDFYFSGAPYVARGDGCYRNPVDANASWVPGTNCCSGNGDASTDNCNGNGKVEYDLGAVWVDQVGDYIAWWVVGPNTKGNNNLSVCDLSTNDAAFVVEFDIDNNFTTGCDNADPSNSCYPGSDYQIWFFPDTNKTLFAYYNGSDANNISFVANTTVSANNMWVSYNCSATNNKDRGFGVIVNKTAAFPGINISLNFETNSFNYSEAVPAPVDFLTPGDALTGAFDSWLITGPGEDAGACFQFDNNQPSCINGSDSFECIWTDFGGGNGLCDPNFQSFSAGASCFQYGSSAACSTDADNVGYCHWESAVTLPNGSTGLCVEDFQPFEFGGGNCDSSCGDCFTQVQCQNSIANGGAAWGGCDWYNDSFNPNGWCDDKDLLFGCTDIPGDCFDSSSCSSSGWSWNTTWNVCLESATDEICFNNVDDNGDGNVDCADMTCENNAACGNGLDVLTGVYAGFTPTEALLSYLTVGMGPVLFLGTDPLDAPNTFVEIQGLGIASATHGLGMGLSLQNLTDLAACGGATVDRQFLYLIDTDANASTGCNVTLDGSNTPGFEYVVHYGNFSLLNQSGQEKYLEACFNGAWVAREAAVISPPAGDPQQPGSVPSMECQQDTELGGYVAVIMLDKADIGNPTSDMRFYGVVVNGSGTNLSAISTYDQLADAYYTPGTQDFEPVDCFEEPTRCGAEFMILGEGEYMPMEDCVSPGDEDADGDENCADIECAFAPNCVGVSLYNASKDNTAPKVKLSTVDEFDTFAVIRWVTDEPTNGSVRFYGTSASCAVLNTTIVDMGIPDVAFDDFRPWHNVPIDNNSLGVALSTNTTYLYKLVSVDHGNNSATSACLNFTTTTAMSNLSVVLNFTGLGVPSDFLGNLEVLIDGVPLSIGGVNDLPSGTFQDVNMTFRNPNATVATNWSVTLVGVDFTQAMVLDFDGAFIANQSNNEPYIGIESADWTNLVQKLGTDYVELTIPEEGDQLLHCADDGTNCTDVSGTEGVVLLSNANSRSVWRLPASLGFSSYSAGGIEYVLNFTNSTAANVTRLEGVNASYLVVVNNTMNTTQSYNFSLELPATVTGTINDSSTVDNITLASNQSTTLNVTVASSTPGTYTFNVIATLTSNASIILNSSDDLTFTFIVSDSTNPAVTSISSGTPGTTSATITWTTDENANSSVTYGTTTALGTTTSLATLALTHSRSLTSLTASTTYNYNVTSCDSAGNCNTTGPNTFTTAAIVSGGGGGGGGGLSASAQLVSSAPKKVALNRYGTHPFRVTGDKGYHTVRISGISGLTVTFIIQSTPVTVSLKDGESTDVDVTDDGEPDVTVALISHTSNQAIFEISSLEELAPVTTETVEEIIDEVAVPDVTTPEVVDEPVVEETTEPDELVGEPEPTPTKSNYFGLILLLLVISGVAWWVLRRN